MRPINLKIIREHIEANHPKRLAKNISAENAERLLSRR